MVQQTVEFESVSLSEVGSGTITAFLFSGATLAATLASIEENVTLKGRYTGTVDDIAAAEYRLVVKFNGYTVNEPDEVVTLLLAVGTYVSKRLAALDAATQTQITAIETFATRVTTGLVQDGLVYQFTANMLELGPAGSSGGGDATLANQEEMIGLLEDLADVQLAAVAVAAGTISGFPEELIIGDSYDENTGQIRVNITDSTTGDPIDSLGSLDFADADVAFTVFRPNDSARISGTCEYVREPVSGALTASYVLITLLTTETALGKAEYTYEGRLKFVWQGPSSSDDSDETQKTYKTTPFKFIANP